MQLSIVIPVRNEQEAIVPVVDGILAQTGLPGPSRSWWSMTARPTRRWPG